MEYQETFVVGDADSKGLHVRSYGSIWSKFIDINKKEGGVLKGKLINKTLEIEADIYLIPDMMGLQAKPEHEVAVELATENTIDLQKIQKYVRDIGANIKFNGQNIKETSKGYEPIDLSSRV